MEALVERLSRLDSQVEGALRVVMFDSRWPQRAPNTADRPSLAVEHSAAALTPARTCCASVSNSIQDRTATNPGHRNGHGRSRLGLDPPKPTYEMMR
jgi:hypothetical protein